MKDIKAAVQGKTVRPDGSVDHNSVALTPQLTLGIIWYDFELPGGDYDPGWLKKDGLLEVIDTVSPWVWEQTANATANYSQIIAKLRGYVPTQLLYPGVYIQNSAEGNPGGGVWTDPVGVSHILTQSAKLYDQGEIAGVLIFAGIWLEAGNMDARLEQSFALPALLQKMYYPHVGTATVKIVGEDHQPIAGANVTVHYDAGTGTSAGAAGGGMGVLVTRRVSDAQGAVQFGGWAGRGKAVPHRVAVGAAGFAVATQAVQLTGAARVQSVVKLTPSS
eukprot:COSAG06_NODE_4677_length_4043_cov_3.965264_4_plen_276_part_00